MARRQLEVSNEVAAELAGSRDAALRTLEEHLDCEVFLRGNIVTLDGEAEAVQAGATVIRELSALVERGHDIGPATIESVARVLESSESPSKVLEDVVWRHRNLRVAPKSVNQKRYVDAIRRSTVTFGVGPAGTGKTFLAMAMATAALSRREVNRIILTRPAVEAGERLGFLPGDLMAKVDPYLRPLFDALNDMMDPERVATHLEKGVIEVAPLAFMRGRTLERLVRDPRRGAEHHARADEDVPDPARVRLADGRHRRRHAGRPAARPEVRACSSSGTSSTDIEGVEFVRFGGDDVVRHKLVQRIVEAYDDPRLRPGQRAAPGQAGSPPTNGVSLLDVEVIGGALPSARVQEAVAYAAASAGIEEGHVAVEFVSSERIAELNLTWRGKVGPTDVLSFPVDEDDEDPFGERELGDVFICPEHTEDLVEAVVHGVLHLTGMDHETDDGEMLALQAEIMGWLQMTRPGSSRWRGGPTSASRRWSTRWSATRWRSSPTSRRRRGGRSAAS